MGIKSKQKILLTITMLVSNRPDTLKKCFKSLEPLLERVSSELIVVDTANDKKALEIAQQYTKNIVHFTWCNDFAAARNAGLSRAKGLWVMYIDDDEWFEDVSELIDFFKNGIYQQYSSATYITRNYTDSAGREYTERVVGRLCKLEPNTRFKGRVHEQLYPLYGPAYYMKSYVHHYGYAFKNEEEKNRHAWRNINLLMEARKENKDNWMAGAHLIQEYFSVKEYYSIIDVAREMRLQKDSYELGRNDFTAYASVMEMRSYIELKRYEVAYSIGKELLEEPRALLIAHLCIASMMPEICLKYSVQQEALQYCEIFWECLKEWQADWEKRFERDAFGLGDKYLTEEQFGKIHMIELHVYVAEKNWEKAKEAFQKIKWSEIESTMKNTFEDTIMLITNTKYEPEYTEALDILLKGKGSNKYLKEQIEKLEGEAKEKVLYCISQIHLQSMEILQYRMQYAALLYDKQGMEWLLDKWKEKNYSYFLPDRDYWKGLKELRIDLSVRLSEVRFYEWITLAEALFEQMPEKDCENIYQVLIRGLEKTDIRLLSITALRLEKNLLARNMKLENLDFIIMEEIWKELYRIARLWMSCAAMLYRESVFQSEMQSMLPAKYQFAWLIFQAQVVKEDSRNFVRKIAEAAKAYLRMEEVCKYILRYYQLE